MSRSTSPSAPVAGAPTQDAFASLDIARFHAKRPLRRLLAWQILRSGLRMAGWAAISLVYGQLVMDAPTGPVLWLLAILLPVSAAIAGMMADQCQAMAEASVAAALRAALSERLQTMPAGLLRTLSPGRATVAIQRHPDAVAGLVIGHRAAAAMMAAGPLLAAAALAAVSWQAALLVLVLTPVMILFFALAGGAIRDRAQAQEETFGHLAAQFADRVRTLPTIVANHAEPQEQAKLAQRLDHHVGRTMAVLRLAFLNAGLIDFFASLSIAMVAVFLGLGHLGQVTLPGFANLALSESLYILTIAPEYFAPFRRYSEQYHAKAEGLAAARALDELLAIESEAPSLPRVEEALAALADMPTRGLIVISGPSGSGKSTLLRRLAGLEKGAGSRGTAPLRSLPCSWIAADSFVAGTTLAQAIAYGLPGAKALTVSKAAERVGLLDDDLLRGGLSAPIGLGGSHLSGGQRMRIATARALLVSVPVLADEPTAKLDPATASTIRDALREIARTRLVVVASHDPDLVRLADCHCSLSPATALERAA